MPIWLSFIYDGPDPATCCWEELHLADSSVVPAEMEGLGTYCHLVGTYPG